MGLNFGQTEQSAREVIIREEVKNPMGDQLQGALKIVKE